MKLSKLKFYYERIKVSDREELTYRGKWLLKNQINYRVKQKISSKKSYISKSEFKDFKKNFVKQYKSKDALNMLLNNNSKKEILMVANKALDNKIHILDMGFKDLGKKVNWVKSPDTGYVWEKKFYLDMYHHRHDLGNVSYLWHINRFQYLVYLGAAYELTSDEKYAKKYVSDVSSWIDSNPYLLGVNWIQAMEMALRIMSWCHGLVYVMKSKYVKQELVDSMIDVMNKKIKFIKDNLSLYNSANNHLISELLGIEFVHEMFPMVKKIDLNGTTPLEMLDKEIILQVLADGVGAEQASSYHIMNIEMIVIAKAILGFKLSAGANSNLKKAMDYIYDLTTDEYLSEVGDYADIRALYYKKDYNRAAFVLKMGEKLLKWKKPKQISRIYSTGGYAVLQKGKVKLIANFSNLGYLGAAAHGHCDASSFELFYKDKPFLVDTGSNLGLNKYRPFLKTTKAHNTLMIDGKEFANSKSHFIWEKKYEGKLLSSKLGKNSDEISVTHNAYQKLGYSFSHIRNFKLDSKMLVIKDALTNAKNKVSTLNFNLHPDVKVKRTDNKLFFENGNAKIKLVVDHDAIITITKGSDDPVSGWYSNGNEKCQNANHIEINLTNRNKIISYFEFL